MCCKGEGTMKTGLLILVGGRQIPNILTAQHLNADIILPIVSFEALEREWLNIKPALEEILPEILIDPIEHSYLQVDAFDLKQIEEAIERGIADYPDTSWVFNITCATTIMSIAAYNVGNRHNASIWYLNTAKKEVVTLFGTPPKNDLYNLSVNQYMYTYDRNCKKGTMTFSPELIRFAKELAQSSEDAMEFRKNLQTFNYIDKNVKKNNKDYPRWIQIKKSSVRTLYYCEQAKNAHMLDEYEETSEEYVKCLLSNGNLWKFMEGTWLEIYAWACAQEVGIFDDYCMNLEIFDLNGSKHELDLAITYDALLTIAECKSEEKPFQTEHLTKLRAVSKLIGGNFVSCIFITGQVSSKFPGPAEKHDTFEHFKAQAKAHRIVVVPGEELPNLKTILKREAGACPQKRPTFERG